MRTSFVNYPNCHSGSCQDEFIARLLNFQKNGTYVDIGSQHSMFHNNSYYLSMHLDWRGICIEKDPGWDDSYKQRSKCLYLNTDATTIDYGTLFTDQNMPQSIDYLSLDVDILDLEVAKILPWDQFRFKFIGIEHDYYQHGDTYRAPQREYFLSLGYILVCADIYVRNPNFENCAYEDWYLDPAHFNEDIITKLTSNGCYSEDIIAKLTVQNNI